MHAEATVPVTPLWPELPLCESPRTLATPAAGTRWQPLEVDLLGTPVTFHLRKGQPPPPADACPATLDLGGTLGRLHVDAAWLDALCQRAGLCHPPQTSWPRMAAPLRAWLVSCLLAPLWSRLTACCGHDVTPTGREWPDAEPSPLQRVDVCLDEAACHGVMWLELPDATLRRLPQARAHEALWLRLPLTAALIVGRQALSVAQLASLRPDDVVLLDQPQDGFHLAMAPALVADVHERDDVYVVGSAWYIDERQEIRMNDIDTDPASPPSVTLDQLTVSLACEVGRLTMSLADLRALEPGSVLPMGRRAEQAVDLMVNGQRIGHGELVRLDGALGVRVTRLADAHG